MNRWAAAVVLAVACASMGTAAPGDLIWSYTTTSTIDYTSPAVSGGNVYIGNDTGNLYCLNAVTGAPVWVISLGGRIGSSPTPWGDYVYVGCDDGRVYCRNAATGAHVWWYDTGARVPSSPAVSGGRVYIGSDGGRVHCLDAFTGGGHWYYETGGAVQCSPSVAGDRVYVSSNDGYDYCLDAATGHVEWSQYTGDTIAYSSPAVCEDRVYRVTQSGLAYCRDTATGALVWNTSTGPSVLCSLAVWSGKVYVGHPGGFWCLNANTGSVLWTGSACPGASNSSPAVSGGYVYFGASDHCLYCLEATTGATVWNASNSDSVWSSPAVYHGRVYYGCWDGVLYCREAGAHDAGEWPMFRRDLQHTGNLERQTAIPLEHGWNLCGYSMYTRWPINLSAIRVCDGADVRTWDAAEAEGWIQDPAYYFVSGEGYRELGNPAPPAHSNEIYCGYGYWLLTYRPGLMMLIPMP